MNAKFKTQPQLKKMLITVFHHKHVYDVLIVEFLYFSHLLSTMPFKFLVQEPLKTVVNCAYTILVSIAV